VEISVLAKNRFLQQLFLVKAIVLVIFALALLGGSSCTKVHVVVRAPATGSQLTGTNCKLQKELRNQHQQTDYWCWAAAAQTVIQYLKQAPVQQCDLVHAVFRDELMSGLPPSSDDLPIDSASEPANQTSVDLLPHCCMVADRKPIDPNEDPWHVQKAAQVCWRNGRADMVFDRPEFRMDYLKHEYEWTYQGPKGLPWDEIVTEICEDRPIITAIAPDVGGAGHAVVIGGYTELGDGSRWVQVYDPGYSTIGDSYIWLYEVYLGDPGVFTHVRDYTNISVGH
jgi:hypothetical protein